MSTVLLDPRSPVAADDPMVPRPVRVRKRTRDLPGTVTLELVPTDGAPLPRYAPGQFTMLYVFGVGAIPVSDAVTMQEPGDVLGLRGPFVSAWPRAALEGQ